jgi:hypothetical protein
VRVSLLAAADLLEAATYRRFDFGVSPCALSSSNQSISHALRAVSGRPARDGALRRRVVDCGIGRQLKIGFRISVVAY